MAIFIAILFTAARAPRSPRHIIIDIYSSICRELLRKTNRPAAAAAQACRRLRAVSPRRACAYAAAIAAAHRVGSTFIFIDAVKQPRHATPRLIYIIYDRYDIARRFSRHAFAQTYADVTRHAPPRRAPRYAAGENAKIRRRRCRASHAQSAARAAARAALRRRSSPQKPS